MVSKYYMVPRARAFGRRAQTIAVKIDPEGAVLVWDDVVGRYTTSHSLLPRALARVRRAAPA